MKSYLLLIIMLVSAQVAVAQDVIVKINGSELKAKVLEITPSHLIYLTPDTTDTLRYQIAKADVFMVRYANGTKDVFQDNLLDASEAEKRVADPEQMYQKGRADALLYYKGDGVVLGSAATMFIVGPVGPIVIGAVKPKGYNNAALPYTSLQDPNYIRGYEKQAHNRKVGKAALGAGIGTLTMGFLIFLTAGLSK